MFVSSLVPKAVYYHFEHMFYQKLQSLVDPRLSHGYEEPKRLFIDRRLPQGLCIQAWFGFQCDRDIAYFVWRYGSCFWLLYSMLKRHRIGEIESIFSTRPRKLRVILRWHVLRSVLM